MLQSLRQIFPFTIFSDLVRVPPKMSEIKIVRKPRYDGRIKKRQWEERRSDKGAGLGPVAPKVIKKDVDISTELLERIKRRKFAVLLGYCGTNYYGMQRNPATPTIEEEFFKALYSNKYISDENFAQVQTMQFQRAARTDRGVSAARQVVSLKLPETIELSKVNEKLPSEIRVFGLKRVTKGFNCKVQCDSRTYLYLLPTVAFAPCDQIMVQKGFRISEETIAQVNTLLEKYLGTKNFHNFTSKKAPTDPSAKRHMKSIACGTPFIENDVEFAVIKIRGQSFMLHQIRKMVGLIIAIVKGYSSSDMLETAFNNEKIYIPRAPGLGLVLDYVHYERYDFRYGEDGVHEKLTWDELDGDVEAFRREFIYPTILNTEIKDEEMVHWIIRKLTTHKFDEAEEEEEEKSDSEQRDNEKSDSEQKVEKEER